MLSHVCDCGIMASMRLCSSTPKGRKGSSIVRNSVWRAGSRSTPVTNLSRPRRSARVSETQLRPSGLRGASSSSPSITAHSASCKGRQSRSSASMTIRKTCRNLKSPRCSGAPQTMRCRSRADGRTARRTCRGKAHSKPRRKARSCHSKASRHPRNAEARTYAARRSASGSASNAARSASSSMSSTAWNAESSSAATAATAPANDSSTRPRRESSTAPSGRSTRRSTRPPSSPFSPRLGAESSATPRASKTRGASSNGSWHWFGTADPTSTPNKASLRACAPVRGSKALSHKAPRSARCTSKGCARRL
mmetsp:Transcript_6908/g.24370  ORF Transcript_6908/g.24370 Transcript_6908/m.24370 type:complete len:308 (-) Transcript_6908:1698-2621(-)